MGQFLIYLALFASLFVISIAEDAEKSNIERVEADIDEGSCICGLNKEILDKLEWIIKISQSSQCSLPSSESSQFDHDPRSNETSSEQTDPSTSTTTQPPTSTTIWGGDSNSSQASLEGHNEPAQLGVQDNNNNNYRPQQSGSYDGYQDQQQNSGMFGSHFTNGYQAQLGGSYQWNGQQIKPIGSDWSSPFSGQQPQQIPSIIPWLGNYGNSLLPPQHWQQINELSGQAQQQSQYNSNQNQNNYQAQQQEHPINAGFLQGLTNSGSANELAKLNQSLQVDTSQIQSALESTVPSLISNIFSNIQNVTIQSENDRIKYPMDGQIVTASGHVSAGDVLTSIDGSSVQLQGNSTEQITAQGEQLFLQWIDHQIQVLHLTASTANYIRKSALNLFRRIARQYVQRIERLGGRVEDNVVRATQIALHNTQNLIAFILKNYINFAGGLMQIIGEQVSRVGKRIDSTGETIANVNLNPFDIVSDVIASLPNPSRYSEYFRAFGKYLMGEVNTTHSSNSLEDNMEQASSSNQQQQPPKGLFSKTMGSLGKTLGSWIG